MTIAILIGYIVLLLGVTLFSTRGLKKTAGEFFLASRGIGSFMLLMSVFGTTMTAFALVGSTGKSFAVGIGVYGLLASWSGIGHSLCIFLIGTRVWALGKRHGYLTQLAFLRDRYRSDALVLILFPLVVGFVVIYVLMGVVGSGRVLQGLTAGRIPYEAGMGAICLVVLSYVFFGGMRATAWANTFQTIVFMVMGVVAFLVIMNDLGGPVAATERLLESPAATKAARAGHISQLEFLSFGLIPLSIGMFPHVFQHWLTAKKASTFKLTIIAHPICIAITWAPCVLIGLWAAAELPADTPQNLVLAKMVAGHSGEILSGLIGAGILAAIMSSMDSQFLCLGSLFTNDIVDRYFGKGELSDQRKVFLGRVFVILMVAVAFVIGLFNESGVFKIGVWCFTGFASLVPMVFAALYWKRSNKYGAIASVVSVAALWLYFLPQVLGAQKSILIAGMLPVTVITAVSTVALVVVTLVTPPPDRETVEKFFGSRG